MRAALARIVATGVIAVGSVGTALAADAVLGVAADTWTFSVSASVVYAARGDSADSVLIEDTVTGDTVLDASGFDLGWAPGVDLRAEAMNGTWGGGLRFLGGFSWDNTQTATSPAIWRFPTVPPLFGLGVANITAGYSSDLNSFEANGIWRATPRIVAFGGLRWIGIDEDLDMRADFNQATVSMDTSSQGIGPQIGAQVRAIEPGQMLGPVFLDLDGRVGALYMKHKADFGVQQTIGPAFEFDGDDSEWSFVGEIGAAAGIQVSSNVDITLGYRLLYLSDVAVAPIQLPNVDVLSASVNPATSDYWIHGVTLGVNVRF